MKKVKCYNFNNVIKIIGVETINEFKDFLKVNDCEIFYPYKSSGSGRARKKPELYIKTNSYFDKWIKGKNLFNVIQGKQIIKPSYVKYD